MLVFSDNIMSYVIVAVGFIMVAVIAIKYYPISLPDVYPFRVNQKRPFIDDTKKLILKCRSYYRSNKRWPKVKQTSKQLHRNTLNTNSGYIGYSGYTAACGHDNIICNYIDVKPSQHITSTEYDITVSYNSYSYDVCDETIKFSVHRAYERYCKLSIGKKVRLTHKHVTIIGTIIHIEYKNANELIISIPINESGIIEPYTPSDLYTKQSLVNRWTPILEDTPKLPVMTNS